MKIKYVVGLFVVVLVVWGVYSSTNNTSIEGDTVTTGTLTVGNLDVGGFDSLSGAQINADNNVLKNVGNPVDCQDVVTKDYVDKIKDGIILPSC